MKFNIEVGKFTDILNTFSLNNCKDLSGKSTRLIEECLIKSGNDCIELIGLDAGKIVFSHCKIKDVNISEEGALPIHDINLLSGILNLFNKNDEVEISTIKDKVRIFRKYPKKAVRFNLVNINEDELNGIMEKIEYDKNNFKFTSNEYPVMIETHSQHFKEIIDAGSLKSDEGNVFDYIYPLSIIREGKKYILKVDMGDDKFVSLRSEIPANIKFLQKVGKNKDIEFTTYYKIGFDIIGKLNGTIKLFVDKDKPLAILQEQKDLEYFFLIAPASRE